MKAKLDEKLARAEGIRNERIISVKETASKLSQARR